ncbi:MAG: NACHT domain-containing protein [Cyanobacteria bacterium J06621_3]
MTGSELLVGAAAKGIAALITDTTKTGSSNAVVSTIKGLKDKSKQAIFNASRKYIETYQKRHCQLKVLGMREPVDLVSVYTGVKLLDSRDVLQFDPQALEETFRQNRLRGYSGRGREDEKRSGITIANQKQYLMVLGGPGAGKSTFLRKVGLEALRTFYYERAEYQFRLIPVLLELKRFEADDVDIEKFITAELKTCGFPEAEAFTQNSLAQGNLLVMLDGLDEVPSANLDNVLTTIRDFVDRNDGNRFIASCRVAASGYRGRAFQRFSNVTMADFDDEQIQRFIGNWFSDELDMERKTAAKCWEVLQKPENKASKELAHTPLLLTYLCLVYGGSQRFPDNRSSLYKKALRILLEEWAAEKRILRDDIYEGLSIEQEEILLSEIAYDGMKADQLFFDKRWLSAQIREFLASNLNAPKGLDSEKVLNAIEVQQGILVERMEDQYSFSHLTLQEYLTAQYLIDNNEWSGLVHQHILDNRWLEIFLLLPGLMVGKSGVDSLLLEMKKQADDCINTPRLIALVMWAETATDKTEKNLRPSVRRSASIILVLARSCSRSLDIDNTHARSLDIACACALDLAINLNLDLNHNLTRSLDVAIARAIDINLKVESALDLTLVRAFKDARVFSDVFFGDLVLFLEHLRQTQPAQGASYEEEKKLVESVCSFWLSVLNIDSNTAALTQKEAQSLSDYCNICQLMVRCKESAIRVSPDVWKSIESSILTVPATSETADADS